MTVALDPWTDAQALAQRLRAPGSELLVALGAEAWCDKCKTLRPLFEQLCSAQAPAQVTWLWLDLEEHAEFLGDFVPEDLPLLLRWRAGQLVQAAVLEGILLEQQPAEQLRLLQLPADAPELWRVFSAAGWAQ